MYAGHQHHHRPPGLLPEPAARRLRTSAQALIEFPTRRRRLRGRGADRRGVETYLTPTTDQPRPASHPAQSPPDRLRQDQLSDSPLSDDTKTRGLPTGRSSETCPSRTGFRMR
jgi:hypothetical protein